LLVKLRIHYLLQLQYRYITTLLHGVYSQSVYAVILSCVLVVTHEIEIFLLIFIIILFIHGHTIREREFAKL